MKLGALILVTLTLHSPWSFAQERNALIPLRLKEMARPDRIPDSQNTPDQLFKISANLKLPNELADDRWPGEQFSEIAHKQLKKIVSAHSPTDLEGLLGDDFHATKLEPVSPHIKIIRHHGKAGELTPCSAKDLAEQLKQLGKTKTKVIKTSARSTLVHVEANRDKPRRGEYSARWLCTWDQQNPPRLLSLKVEHFEISYAPKPWMSDSTHAVIGHNPRFAPQVLRGIEYWAQRITRIGDLAMTGHHGIAVGDVNGDGLEDLYVCDGGSLPNQLYLQQSDGTALDVAAEWGVAWLEDSRGALLIDLDNDGDQDLVVSTIAMIAFAENNGAGKFELRGGFPGAPYPFSLSAADYDSDGDLDIYTCVYSPGDQSLSGKRGFEAASPTPFNDAQNGGRNVLLANLGGFRFQDKTKETGLEQNNTRWSFAASWEDYDRDGDPDLYVANDFGRNCLYRNDNGRFTDVAKETGVEDIGAGMSVSWGDTNRDGAADLLVGNMFSSAGRRIAAQKDFDQDMTRMARGNSLFTGKGDQFLDQSTSITTAGWAWSSALADLDNDGWQDVIVANGYLSNTLDNDL